MPLQIEKGNPAKPVRVLVYGIEGSGKSTFGAKADKPVFITPEGGVDQIRGAEMIGGITTWDQARQAIKDLTTEKHNYKTLVIDSADWLEQLCHAKIIGTSHLDIIRVNKGYGAGYREAQRLHKELLDDLSLLRDKRDMNIIITAHYQVKPVKDPELLVDYDQFEIKCHEFVSSLYREWVDALLFVRFRTLPANSDKTDKARAVTDGTRVVYTVKRPAFQAKNRYGLPEEMEFTLDFWSEFMKYARKGLQPVDLNAEINDLLARVSDGVTVSKVRESLVSAKGNPSELERIHRKLKDVVGT